MARLHLIDFGAPDTHWIRCTRPTKFSVKPIDWFHEDGVWAYRFPVSVELSTIEASMPGAAKK